MNGIHENLFLYSKLNQLIHFPSSIIMACKKTSRRTITKLLTLYVQWLCVQKCHHERMAKCMVWVYHIVHKNNVDSWVRKPLYTNRCMLINSYVNNTLSVRQKRKAQILSVNTIGFVQPQCGLQKSERCLAVFTCNFYWEYCKLLFKDVCQVKWSSLSDKMVKPFVKLNEKSFTKWKIKPFAKVNGQALCQTKWSSCLS